MIRNLIKRRGIAKCCATKEMSIEIFSMEERFKASHKWVNGTGTGVKDVDGAQSLIDTANKYFKCYFDLEPFYKERDLSNPDTVTDGVEDHKGTNVNDDGVHRDSHVSHSHTTKEIKSFIEFLF